MFPSESFYLQKDVMRMKKCCALAAALCLSLSPLSSMAETFTTPAPLEGYTLRQESNEMLVFATKNLKANIVGYIKPGTDQEVHVIAVENDWCYIRFSSMYGMGYGYVPLSYFDVTPVATPTPATVEQIVYHGGTPAWISNADEGFRLNLRAEPAATARSLGKYFTGVPVILTGNAKNGFVQVLVGSNTFGWLDERYITLDALAFVPETPLVSVVNPGGSAAMRSGPGSSYDRISLFAHGMTVTVLGVRDDGWYHVQVGELTGFMPATMLSGQFSFDHGMDSDNPAHNEGAAQQTQYMYINTRTSGGQLNLRKSASVSSKSLGVFYTGTPVTVLSYTRDGWANVRIGQTEGYMDADYLTAGKPTQYGVTRTVRNSRATGLNMRALPSTGGELLDFAPNYATLTVLGELSDGWCYVEYNGVLGYMMGTYLK